MDVRILLDSNAYSEPERRLRKVTEMSTWLGYPVSEAISFL